MYHAMVPCKKVIYRCEPNQDSKQNVSDMEIIVYQFAGVK